LSVIIIWLYFYVTDQRSYSAALRIDEYQIIFYFNIWCNGCENYNITYNDIWI